MAIALRSRSTFRSTATLAVLVVVAALCGPVAAATAGRWIVPSTAVLPTGSVIVGSFPLADALVITAPVAPDSGVAYDTELGLQSLPAYPDAETGLRIDSGVASTGAPDIWTQGELGAGAVVALIDTGVAPVEALANSVVGEIDFSGDGGGDGYGHGTFMASLIAGNAQVAPGAAPRTGILSLKVGRDDGTTSLGSVLSAMHWLHTVGRFAGIRIATLALGVDADTDAAYLLDAASDALARSGLLLVTSAGNDGPGNLTSPATATGTFSVGAFDDNGTATTSDDLPADFSGSGPDRHGVAQLDVSASGSKLVGWMSHDSVVAVQNPGARFEDDLIRGSGTSMSTALVAGVAALASSARPDLDGEGLAAALRASGATLDAAAVVAAAKAAPAGNAVKSKWESAEEAPGARGKRKGHADKADPHGIRWGGIRWGGIRWGGIRWGDDHWDGIRWGGIRWGGIRWGGIRWGGSAWSDGNWEPGQWGGIRWTDRGWVGDEVTPQGIRWGGIRWAGVRWTGIRWGGSSWSLVEAPLE